MRVQNRIENFKRIGWQGVDSVVQRRRHSHEKRTGFLLSRVDLRNGGGGSEGVPGGVEVGVDDGDGVGGVWR